MKGILFKPDMHKAIKEGRKTVTRRVINLDQLGWLKCDEAPYCFVHKHSGEHIVIKPRYQVGEIVYIKEAYWQDQSGGIWGYKLDGMEWPPPNCGGKAISPLFMSAWAARDFIQITDERAERLQEITPEDVRAEGLTDSGIIPVNTAMLVTGTNNLNDLRKELGRAEYASLWNSINKLPYDWESNPWVWRYEFKPIAPPIRRQEQ